MTAEGWHAVCPVGEVPEDEIRCFDLCGRKIAVYNTIGKFFATADMCTHAEASLADIGYIEDCKVVCSLHMATFDLNTGEATAPAYDNIEVFETDVRSETIFVKIKG